MWDSIKIHGNVINTDDCMMIHFIHIMSWPHIIRHKAEVEKGSVSVNVRAECNYKVVDNVED